MKNKGFSEKSRGKIKKLCTGVKSCSPSNSEILFTPKKQSIFEKKIKKTRAIACSRARNRNRNSPRTTSGRIRPQQSAPHTFPFCRCGLEEREITERQRPVMFGGNMLCKKQWPRIVPQFDNKYHVIYWIR